MKQTANQNLLPHQTTVRRSVWQAWVLLALGLIATAAAAFYVKMDAEADAKQAFDFACDEIRLKIDARLNAHAQILRSGAAFFNSSDEVTRKDWHTFTMRQKVEQQLPGIQGIGFSLLIPREQLAQHIREIRAQGFPEYHIRPEGEREIYTSVIYLEPFSGRNLCAFGYDMFSEPVRHAAMEMARDTDSAALSGKVVLVQETDKDVQPGTLMYVPVYRKGIPTDTVEQRRAALYGWVYSPYRMKDLMHGISGGWDLHDQKRIRLQVFDGAELVLLYDSQPDKALDSSLLFSRSFPIDSAGRRWALRFMQTGGKGSPIDFAKVWLIISGGMIISLLLFWLLISLFNTRFKARQIADRLTVDLRESEERYKRLSDLTFEGILFHRNGIIIDCNQSFAKLTGYSRKELPGKDSIPLLIPEKYHPILRQNIAQKNAQPYEVELLTKNHSLIPIEIQTRDIVLEGEEIRVAAVRDITDRKQAEAALRDSALYTRSLIEASLDPLVTIGYDGKITDVNKATEAITGYPKTELIGSNFADYFTEPERAEAGYNQVFKTGSVRDYELHIRHKGGKITPVLYHASVYRDESGKIIGVFAAARDISVRRQMEEERLRLERQLSDMKKYESLIRTTAGIAHNFNNIFFAITGNMEMAMDDIPHRSSARRLLEEAFKAANRAADLTRKILAYSGSGFFSFTEVDVSRMIKENTHTFKSAIPETVDFSLNLREDIPPISADPEQIQRLIMNILVNASEAIGENPGTVTLSTGVTDSYDDSLSSGLQRIDDSEEKPTAGRFVHIEISDTGCGMSEETVKLLFDPFFTTKFMGRGLGMSEVQGIVRTHKGAILLKSEPGRGTTLRILFPVSESVPKITEQKPVHQEISQTDSLRKMILVVDDEETVRDVCDMMLEHLGYRRLMAADGDKAVEIFREQADDIHCVLLDLTMPKKDGISAFKEMRRIREDVRVVISSGHSKDEISRRFKDYGLAGVLQKPYSLKDLRHELKAIMKS